jgi:uncharacterized protein
VSLDFIRGIAVLGILFANIVAFSNPMMAYSWPGAMPEPFGPADNAIWVGQYVLIDGKMRGLFSLLFGAGMALFMERAWARGDTGWRQVRRLFLLMGFGLIHFFFIWWGDILFLYGMSGLLAMAMLEMKPKVQIGFGITWYLFGGLFFALSTAAGAIIDLNPQIRESMGALAEITQTQLDEGLATRSLEIAAFSKGSYAAEFLFIVKERAAFLASYPVYALLETVPLMLIGMGLYRSGFFSGDFDRKKMVTWGWVGLLFGGGFMLMLGMWAMNNGFSYGLTEFVFNGASQIPRLPIVLGLAALFVVWAPSASKSWLGSRFVAAGRMAFSNYIGTSVLMMLIFRQWAGGLWGELGRVELVGVVLFAWVLMLLWSKPWLEHFRYGPLEWLWRCLTYGKLFPMRRAAAS